MKILALGFYGLMVVSASAGERWPERYCAELRNIRTIIDSSGSEVAKANQRFAVLLLQEAHCGLATRGQQDADAAVTARASRPTPRQPTNCLSVPMTGGAVATGCN